MRKKNNRVLFDDSSDYVFVSTEINRKDKELFCGSDTVLKALYHPWNLIDC
jgi:hypothetical protein